MEHKFLSAAFHDRNAFTTLESLDLYNTLSDKAKVIWETIQNFYNKDSEVSSVDKEVALTQVERSHPKHAQTFKHLIDSLEDVSIPNVVEEFRAHRIQSLREELGAALISGAKEYRIQELTNLLEQAKHVEEVSKEERIYRSVPVSTLVENSSSEHRIKLLPGALNSQCKGGALRGHHIVLFAPTDMGKTLFTINLTAGFLQQGYTTLYVGNEDPSTDILKRLISRLVGKDDKWVDNNPDLAQQLADEKGYSNLIFYDADPGTPKEIEELIQEFEPAILIGDQIRNFNMPVEGKVLQLEAAATFMRNMAKKYNLLSVSITQAGDSATGKLMLGRGDIDFSNVGIPGQADLLIGIGANQEWEDQGYRMLSLIKNKIGADKTPIKVRFIPSISRVESI